MKKLFNLLTITACFTLLFSACKKNEVEKPGNGSSDGHEYIDLGLPSGIKWATCNVGASSPEEYGFYYAWGETAAKGMYDLDSYIWYDKTTQSYTKYTWDNNDITIESSDDAATANWGDKWRMPTQDEIAELLSNCNWQWTTQNSINGWLVKGSNGNSIFLPASGEKYNSTCDGIGECASYWASSLQKMDPYYYENPSSHAKCLAFEESDMGIGCCYRARGLSVRPVYSGKAAVTTSEISEVSYYSATCGGYVSAGTSSVSARGVCWSTSQNPTIDDAHTSDGEGTGAFTSNITGLTADTKYFVRAYATNSAGTSYGLQINFSTKTPTMPTATTDTIMEYTATGAIIVGSVTDDGGSEVTERGICWNTETEPTIENHKVSCGSGMGRFVTELSDLEPDNVYYVRAFATNSKGTSYGRELTIELGSGVLAGHPYVDLGLPSGTLWATYNVGACVTEGHGELYAWGETATKDYFEWSNYKWCGGSSYTLTKYCTDSYYGNVDGKSRLEPTDDVATVKWGDTWRMPTYEEMNELTSQCTMNFETRNNIKGLLFTGPNGRSIFLPVCFYSSGNGYYWSSDLCYRSYEAHIISFNYGYYTASLSSSYRSNCNHVRPVATITK